MAARHGPAAPCGVRFGASPVVPPAKHYGGGQPTPSEVTGDYSICLLLVLLVVRLAVIADQVTSAQDSIKVLLCTSD